MRMFVWSNNRWHQPAVGNCCVPHLWSKSVVGSKQWSRQSIDLWQLWSTSHWLQVVNRRCGKSFRQCCWWSQPSRTSKPWFLSTNQQTALFVLKWKEFDEIWKPNACSWVHIATLIFWVFPVTQSLFWWMHTPPLMLHLHNPEVMKFPCSWNVGFHKKLWLQWQTFLLQDHWHDHADHFGFFLENASASLPF